MAAVGLANQIFFLLNILLFGITSGSAMFTAQLWGKRDILNIRKVLGLALSMGLSAGILFLIIAEVFPTQALSIYSKDKAVITLGSDYLRIIGFSFILYAISFCYSSILRSTGDVQTPLFVTIAALSLNMVLSYTLIFNKLGLPELGVHGAAMAVLSSRVVECCVLLWLRASKMVLFIGVFRSGGDTRFAFLLDGVIIWAVGVPLAFMGAFLLHLPVYWVYLLAMTEELTKWLFGMYRFFSRKWIHNLAQSVGN